MQWAGLVAGLLVVLVLSGCAGSPAPAALAEDDPPAAILPRLTGVQYGCPGATAPSATPCDAWSPAVQGMSIIDVAFRDDPPLIAAIGTSLPSGYSGGLLPIEPGMALMTSTDDGATWSSAPLPTVESDSTRTGRRAPYWAAAEFGADGRLHVLLQAGSDTERSIIGGDVPEQLQPENDILLVSSGDDGRSWSSPVALATGPAASYSSSLSRLADGTLFAVWTDHPGKDFFMAWSAEGVAWTIAAPVRADCRNPTPAVEWNGRVLVACQEAAALGESAADLMVMAADLTTRTVEELDATIDNGQPPAAVEEGRQSEGEDGIGLPACGAVQLHKRAADLVLVLSRCPDIQVFASTNATAWRPVATFGPEQLRLEEGWGSLDIEAPMTALDSTGSIQAILLANRVFPPTAAQCVCVETRVSHAVLDLESAAAVHDVELFTFQYGEPLSAVGTGTNLLALGTAEIGFHDGRGWLLWHDDLTRFSWFTLETMAA